MDGSLSPARARWIAAALIVGVAIARIYYLGFISTLDLAPDEAHYWDWSRQLDWSYYSKGPMIALLIRASCFLFGPLSLWLTNSEVLAVRLPAVICGSMLLASLYTLTMQVYARPSLALGVVVLASCFPLMAVGALIMTIDAPFTCFWGWALVFGYSAVFGDKPSSWFWAGLFIALGVLTKPTMVLFVPCFGLFLLATPSQRHLLRRPGFWVMTSLGVLGGVPIVMWNIANGWVTLLHTGGHAGISDQRPGITWRGPVVFLGTQFAMMLGYWFVVWACCMWSSRPGRQTRSPLLYLWWMSAPLVGFFLLFSFKNGGGEPNWPIVGYLSGMVLAAGWLVEQLQSPRAWYRRSVVAFLGAWAILDIGVTALMHDCEILYPLLKSQLSAQTDPFATPMRRLDPTCRLRGWHTLASAVDSLRDELAKQGIDALLAGGYWNLPSEIAFYCHDHPSAYSFSKPLGGRSSQYDLWHPNPVADDADFKGKTFVIVLTGDTDLTQAFDEVSPYVDVVHRVQGEPIAHWRLVIARGYRGFPRSKSEHY